jgi:hypothetical protein
MVHNKRGQSKWFTIKNKKQMVHNKRTKSKWFTIKKQKANQILIHLQLDSLSNILIWPILVGSNPDITV